MRSVAFILAIRILLTVFAGSLLPCGSQPGVLTAEKKHTVNENADESFVQLYTALIRNADTAAEDFLLPASLEIIDEEAFEGTSIRKTQLPDTLYAVRDRAFANILNLEVIRISGNPLILGDDIFLGAANTLIIGMPGSISEKWAVSHEMPFAPYDMLYYIDGSRQFTGQYYQRPLQGRQLYGITSGSGCSGLPLIRTAGYSEMIIGEYLAAEHILERAPPAIAQYLRDRHFHYKKIIA